MTVFIAGVLVNTAQASMPSLAAAFYPTAGRGTGVAWMVGVGRFERVPLKSPEPLRNCLHGSIGEVFRGLGPGKPAVGVGTNAVTDLTAKHAMDRYPEGTR